MANLTFNAIDVETANRTRASICQIGIAQVQVGKIKRAASFLVNPEEPFESFQTSIHGINEEAVSEAETMLSIHPKLYRLIEGAPLASHSQFDKQALEKAASKYGLTMPRVRWLDTGRVARTAWPDRYDGSSWGLKKIAADLGIMFLHHDAAEDARAAAEILLTPAGTPGSIWMTGWNRLGTSGAPPPNPCRYSRRTTGAGFQRGFPANQLRLRGAAHWPVSWHWRRKRNSATGP